MQYLRRGIDAYLRPMHEGFVQQSPLREMPALQRLL
jgi:hypothetical protein